VNDVHDVNGEVTSAIPPHRTTAHGQQAEQADVHLRFALCCKQHTTTPAARAAMLVEVGHLIGVTKDQIQEIQNKARMKLRRLLAERS
jgi:hypothetical protein